MRDRPSMIVPLNNTANNARIMSTGTVILRSWPPGLDQQMDRIYDSTTPSGPSPPTIPDSMQHLAFQLVFPYLSDSPWPGNEDGQNLRLTSRITCMAADSIIDCMEIRLSNNNVETCLTSFDRFPQRAYLRSLKMHAEVIPRSLFEAELQRVS